MRTFFFIACLKINMFIKIRIYLVTENKPTKSFYIHTVIITVVPNM